MLSLRKLWNDWIGMKANPADANATLAEEEAKRRGRMLSVLVAAGLPLSLLLLPVCLLPRPVPSYLAALLVWLLVQVGSVQLGRSDQTHLAGRCYLLGLFAACGLGLFSKPIQTLPLSLFCSAFLALPIVASGFLLGRAAPFVCATLSGSLVVTHIALNTAHYSALPGFDGFPLLGFALLPCAIYFLLALLTVTAESSMNQAILHARQVGAAHEQLEAHHEAVTEQADQLSAINADLLAVQAELEAQYRALEAANAQLAALATSDGMTGLSNHRAFHEELTHQIARVARSRAPLTLMLLDVDYFKQYNDAFGHPAGDEILKSMAQILRSRVREGDFPARYGGEEFAVVLQDTDAETAYQVAERIRAEVETHPFPHRAMTVSIGLAQYKPGEEAYAMIQRADVALYEAKSAGRNRIVYLPAEDTTLPQEPGSEQRAGASDADHRLLLFPLSLPEREAETAEVAMPAENGFRATVSTPATFVVQLLGGLEGLLQESPAPILVALLDIMDRRSVESWGHSMRVTRYALRLGSEVSALYEELRPSRPLLPRMTPGDMANLAFGALLHDIGKMGIPDAVLGKQGKLTDDEWRQIRRHPLAGAELIANDPLLFRALPIIRAHHERWDGTGYPQGLHGEAIPLVARIFAVCDAFDSLTVKQAYRDQVGFREACEEIQRGAGTQFDPDVVEAFLSIPETEWRQLASPWTSYPPSTESLRRAA